MPLNGGERAGLLVTLFLVLVSMFLTVVTTAPKGKFIQKENLKDFTYSCFQLKLGFFEKATKFDEISILLLTSDPGSPEIKFFRIGLTYAHILG